MTGFLDFVADPKVHDTALLSMAITAVLAALPKPGTKWTWSTLYLIFYDSLTGFWSMKTGQKPPVNPSPPVDPAQK